MTDTRAIDALEDASASGRPPRVSKRVSDRGQAQFYRHPSDVARLVFWLLVLGGILLLGTVTRAGMLRITLDLLHLFDDLPDALEDGIVGLVQATATVLPIVGAIVLIWRHNFRLLFVLALAAVLAAAGTALLSGVIDKSVPISELGFEQVNSWFAGSQYPSTTFLAALTAILVAAGPWLSKSWRWAGWILIVGMLISRMVTGTSVPLHGGLMLAVGGAAGSLALVIFGAPRRRIDVGAVAESLANAGVPVEEIREYPTTGSDPIFAAGGPDGSEYMVKVLGRDQRDADLLIRMWQALTVKGLGDDPSRLSPVGAVRHEALAMGLFGNCGGRVPEAIAVISTPDEAAVLLMPAVAGRPIGECAPAEVTNAALDDLWTQIGIFQERRLAHRSLDPANVLIDGDEVRLIGLRRAGLQATDEVLGADVAELLATLSLTVGVDRAVSSAAATLPRPVLERAVPMIQDAVFSQRTRRAMHGQDELLDELRDRAADATDIEHVTLAPVQRITVKGTVSLVGSGVLVFYILSLAADWEQIWDSFQQANSWYVIPILALAGSTYLSGAMSLMGAVPISLSFGRTTAVMFGQSFLNRFTPANAGGMAMRVRYLQLSGLDGAVSATSIGLTSAASGIAQALMIVVFLFWGGASDRFSDFEMPDIGSIVILLLIGGLFSSILLVTTWGKEVVRPWVRDIAGKVRAMVEELAKDPAKMSLLFGGAILGKLANIVAFYMSTQAFGVDISFPKAGALYIIATTIGAAVPTPGGVGGVEAALTAALLSFGVDNATAAAIVLFFRILTFWVPTLPGYLFMRYTQNAGIV